MSGPRRRPRAAAPALRTLGLAAVILLAPGGFVLGATLLARRMAARRKVKDASVPKIALDRE